MNRRHDKILKTISTLVLFLFFGINSLSQEDKTAQDSTMIKQDSSVYNSIEEVTRSLEDSSKYRLLQEYSRKSRLTKFLHRLIFHPVLPEKTPQPTDYDKIRSKSLSSAEGKKIRHIRVVILDPFGYSITDTLEKPATIATSSANKVHIKTNVATIRNLLLFHENEPFDSLKIKESERLVRSRRYVRDVTFMIIPVSRDSVDIYTRVLDVWSLIPSLRKTPSYFAFGINDLNFAGTGNSMEVSTWWKSPDASNITHLRFQMPNIRNSWVSLNIQYLFSLNSNLEHVNQFPKYFYTPVSYNPQYLFSDNKNIIKSLEVSRSFYSPYTKWAGGIFIGQMMATQSYIFSDTLRYLSSKVNIRDYWAGRSWKLDIDESAYGITNIVLTGRIVRVNSPGRSKTAADAGIFDNHIFYFGGISLSSRKYSLGKYVFNYGITEDIPAGRIFGLTVGLESQREKRYYLGLNAGYGGYNSYGYLSAHLSYGIFRGFQGFQQGTFTGTINYFTHLFTVDNWKIRQFIRTSFIFGINMIPADNLPLKIGIKGFESIESRAVNISVISLQTQSYAPWNLGGFHFGPYFFAHLGFLKKEPLQVINNKFYSLLGIGVLIKNDYLKFNTFQVSLSFYPLIPDRGYNIFRLNGYKTNDYGLRDFDATKPGI